MIFWLPWILFVVFFSTHFELMIDAFFFNYHNSIVERYSSDVGWFAPFFSGGGYCSEARSFILALDKVGYHNISIAQHGDSWNDEYVRGQDVHEKSIIAKYVKLGHPDGYPKISICHSEPGAWYLPNPRYHTSPCPFIRPNSKLKFYKVGRTMFETDSIPSGWPERLNVMDEVWVPTEESKKIFMNHGVHPEKLRVIPETVDTEFFQYTHQYTKIFNKYGLTHLQNDVSQDMFNFLFVGKFELRKGIDLLIEAYFKEFSALDNVRLILLTSSYHSSKEFDMQIQSIIEEKNLMTQAPPRYTILSNVDQGALPGLYSYVDILVIPSHGEGWGRPHMEAMACQTPVVATNWSGSTAFVNEENGYPLGIDGLVESKSWPGHLWAQPNTTDLRRLMRHTHGHPVEVYNKGLKARHFIERHFSLHQIGNYLVDEFNRILDIINHRNGEIEKIEL